MGTTVCTLSRSRRPALTIGRSPSPCCLVGGAETTGSSATAVRTSSRRLGADTIRGEGGNDTIRAFDLNYGSTDDLACGAGTDTVVDADLDLDDTPLDVVNADCELVSWTQHM
jgi:hypothetical protein